MMLLVHDLFMGPHFETKDADKEETDVVDPFRLKGIAMHELMLTGKGKALELKAVKDIEGNEHRPGRQRRIGIHLARVDGHCCQRHDVQVDSKALEAMPIRFLHEIKKDSIIEDAITFLSFAVLDIGPILAGVDGRETLGIGLFV